MTRTGETVVVTGMGIVSALGVGVEATRRGLYAGSVQPPGSPNLSTELNPAPPVFHVREKLSRESNSLRIRTTCLALEALDEALRRSFGGPIKAAPERLGACLGTTVGCTFRAESICRSIHSRREFSLEDVESYLSNDLSAVLADEVGAFGPRITVTNACSSSTDSVGLAYGWVRSGRCDVVITGGSDELHRFPYLGFYSLKNMSSNRCRPFDLSRSGLNLGEGAAILVLESETHARARRAQVLGRVLGYGAAADAYHATAPHPEGIGLSQAIRCALEDARLTPDEVSFVNAHGTATLENDRVEGKVLKRVFGEHIPFISTKGLTGHTLGAAGAVEAALSLINLADGKLGPSAGFMEFDPECELAPNTAVLEVDHGPALTTSMGFGGASSALILGAPDE